MCNGLNSLWVHGASTAQLINLSRLLGCIDGKELDCGLNEGALPRNKTFTACPGGYILYSDDYIANEGFLTSFVHTTS